MTQEDSRFDVIGQLAALRRYARSLARNDADAEDLVQDTLLRAYEKRAQFRPRDGVAGRGLRGWLLSILHNAFIDRARTRRSEARTAAQAGDSAPALSAPGQDHSVRLAQVRRSFLRLPEEQRAALHLVSIEGLSYQEAADTLGIPVGTLMSRLGRGRAALRRLEEGEASPTHARPGHLKIVGGSDDVAD